LSQEILSDPSYAEQIITLTCPHIGNVGTNQADNESDRVFAKGLVIRDLPEGLPKNWPVEVTFQYASNGRLTVEGVVPGTHQSVTLCLERSTGLSAPMLFTPVATGVRGQAGTTTYTDTSASGPGPFFYRVGVQQ